jgi:hypothetical protein
MISPGRPSGPEDSAALPVALASLITPGWQRGGPTGCSSIILLCKEVYKNNLILIAVILPDGLKAAKNRCKTFVGNSRGALKGA